jgi:hypothetical protein
MDRLRWDNIARAVAVLAVIALIVAWPHLRSREPAMPLAAPTPVSVEQPSAVAGEAPPVEQTPAFLRMSASWSSIQSPGSRSVTMRLRPFIRRARSESRIVSAAWIESAVSWMSNGLTESANSPSSSCAPVFSDRIETPLRSLTSGPSLATRFMPSNIALTSSTS